MISNANVKPQHKPNSALTPEERKAKQRIKKLSKLQSKITKMEKSIAHAQQFSNTNVAENSKETLVDLVNNSEFREIALSFVSEEFKYLFEDGEAKDDVSSADNTTSEPKRIETQAKAIITKVSNELFLHMYADDIDQTEQNVEDVDEVEVEVEEDAERRRKRKRYEAKQKRLEVLRATKAEHQTKAKQMCRAMTKGEQKESMFDDAAALWGYTRQKYVERARLVCQSFLKLHPQTNAPAGTELSTKQIELKDTIWKIFISVGRVCSIGCGPGSDVAGVLALRKSMCMERKKEYISPSAVLSDYVIDQWKGTILDIVLPIVAKEGLVNLEAVACERTDVTKVESNDAFARNERRGKTLYITSYLLSEQRDKWHDYYISLAKEAKSGDIFYFCEPKPWQLHLLIRMTKEWLSFLWLDSSMYFEELQTTDMRAGPAVLVAIKG